MCSNYACGLPHARELAASTVVGVGGDAHHDQVSDCQHDSVVCYARACRFYDTCDNFDVALFPNGTLDLWRHEGHAPTGDSWAVAERLVGRTFGGQVRRVVGDPTTVAPEATPHHPVHPFHGAGVQCSNVIDTPTVIALDFYNMENYYHFHVDLLMRVVAQLLRLRQQVGENDPNVDEHEASVKAAVLVGVPKWPPPGLDPASPYFEDAGSTAADATTTTGVPARLPFWIQGLRALQNSFLLQNASLGPAAAAAAASSGGARLSRRVSPGRVTPFSSGCFHDTSATTRPPANVAGSPSPLCFRHAFVGLPFVNVEGWAGFDTQSSSSWTSLAAISFDALGRSSSGAASPSRTPPAAVTQFMRTFREVLRSGLGLPPITHPDANVSADAGAGAGADADADAGGERATQVRTVTVAWVARARRRRVVNEKELVQAVQAAMPGVRMRLVRFDQLLYRDQVRAAGEYDVIAGMNGAGLINALFRKPCAAAVQLVPYQAPLNYHEFGLLLRATGGPYLEWHNLHAEHMRIRPGMRQPESNQDTYVEPVEFVALIEQAVAAVARCREEQNQV